MYIFVIKISKLNVADLTLCSVEVWGGRLEPDVEEVLTSDHTSLDVDSRSGGKDDLHKETSEKSRVVFICKQVNKQVSSLNNLNNYFKMMVFSPIEILLCALINDLKGEQISF